MKRFSLLLLLIAAAITGHAAIKLKPTDFADGEYQGKLLDGEYDSLITPPESFLGFDAGQRVASPEQIIAAIETWKTQSDRMQVIEYGRTHEGRPLVYVVISTPEWLKQQAQVKADLAKLANPKNLSSNEAEVIIKRLPAVAWMAYSIHGNESSGADAALAAIYHLIASKGDEVKQLLDKQIVIIDPMMNPDGRARFAKELQENRGVASNVDDQSLLHTGSWPYGRTNHYYFDLNRDFIYVTQPETRGRVAAINEWYPQLMIDGHEMGAQDTYLFAPAREPVNPHLPESRKKWGWKFAEDQAQAFDANHWRYYTGEWFENLYPGYSNYAEYRGAVHILYEQARIAEDGVRRPEGRVVTYKEAVHHQLLSTFTNLTSLSKYSKDMYRDFYRERRNNIATSGPYANRTFAILPTDNKTRIGHLLDALTLQNIQVYQLKTKKTVVARDQFGNQRQRVELPKGTLIVPNRQPEARLIATMLEFDAHIKPEVLKEERSRTLRDGSSLMYDTTAWNLTMMYGLKAYSMQQSLIDDVEPLSVNQTQHEEVDETAIAFAVNGNEDASVAFAARLMEQGVHVRVIDKATELGSVTLPRGSVIVTKPDNPNLKKNLSSLKKAASELNLTIHSIKNGMGKGELPDWGGQHFQLLTRPQIAVLAHGGFSSYDVGSVWFSLDENLAIRHSKLNSLNVNYADLRRYNVLIMPEHYQSTMSESSFKMIDEWVKQGGTLIAIGSSAEAIIDQEMTSVKLIDAALEDPETYDLSLQREWMAKSVDIDLEKVNAFRVSHELEIPWDPEVKRLDKEKLRQLDEWQSRFMPSGAFVAARVDQQHFLSFGSDEELPLLFDNAPLFMSDDASEAVTRIGVLRDSNGGVISKLTRSVESSRKPVGWSSIPEDKSMIVRLSGLVWPEAAQRMINAAHLTRESRGKGQVILFATPPNFRGATRATNRMLLNAIVYGPGLGTRPLISL